MSNHQSFSYIKAPRFTGDLFLILSLHFLLGLCMSNFSEVNYYLHIAIMMVSCYCHHFFLHKHQELQFLGLTFRLLSAEYGFRWIIWSFSYHLYSLALCIHHSIDNWLLLSPSHQLSKHHTWILLSEITKAGIIIRALKSIVSPIWYVLILGIFISSCISMELEWLPSMEQQIWLLPLLHPLPDSYFSLENVGIIQIPYAME